MASKTPKINWIDLKRFGADLMISEKNQYRERLSVVVINDINQAISLSNQSPQDFKRTLEENGFSIIPSEIPEHKNRMALAYQNPNGSTGLNPRNFQNVFLNLGRQDIKEVERSEINVFTAPEQSHNEWRNLFLGNRSTYQQKDAEYFVVSGNKENTLQEQFNDGLDQASILYLRNHQVDAFPIDMLSNLGYKGNTLIKVFDSREAAYAEGFDDTDIRVQKLSPFTVPVVVQETGTILAFEDLRQVPEIFNHLPSEHPTWNDKPGIFEDAKFTLSTLNTACKNSLYIMDYANSKAGFETALEHLSNDLRNINKIALFTPTYREGLANPANEGKLLYLRKNQEDQQWYMLTRMPDGNFEKEQLNESNLFTLLNERHNHVITHAQNLSGGHSYSALNNDYQTIPLHHVVESFSKLNLGKDLVVEPEPEKLVEPKPIEPQTPTIEVQETATATPITTSIQEELSEEVEQVSIADLMAQAGIKTGAQIEPPIAVAETKPNEATVEAVSTMVPTLQAQINRLEQDQQSLDVDTAQVIDTDKIDNAIDPDALAMIQEIGRIEREKTELARKQYLENMQSAIKGTLGEIKPGSTLDEALEQIAPASDDFDPEPEGGLPLDQEEVADQHVAEYQNETELQNEFAEYVAEHPVEVVSSDVIAAPQNPTAQLDTVMESGSDTLVFEDPNTLYSELEVVVQEASYIPEKFVKGLSPELRKQAQDAQSYRLYAKLYLLPEAQKEVSALQQLNITLINERNSVLEREMINNMGLSSDLFPLTTSTIRPLEEVTEELKLVQEQLGTAMDNQDAIQYRIMRVENVFERSLEENRLVYTDDEKIDQQALDDRVTQAYQTLFSNESYRQEERLDQFVAPDVRKLLETEYKVNSANKLSPNRLPRFNRPISRNIRASLKERMKARLNKYGNNKPSIRSIYATATHKRVIDNVSMLIGRVDGRSNDLPELINVSKLFKGMENLTGEYPFQFADKGSNLDRMMAKLADATYVDTSRYAGYGVKPDFPKDDYGFPYSSQAVTDARHKIRAWVQVSKELAGDTTAVELMSGRFTSDTANIDHEYNLGRSTTLTAYFVMNHIDGKQPTLDGVKSVGWAMVKPNNEDQFKIKPYDLNEPLDGSLYQPLKSRNYETALRESFDQFRLNYTYSRLNIEKNQVESLEEISKLIRTSKPENEARFKALSQELWGQELTFDDFKDENFKLVEPSKEALASEVMLDLQMGNSTIKNISAEEIDRYSNTFVLAKILADAPLNKLNYDILPEETNATAYASYIAPNEEFAVLRDYFKPTAQDEAIPFESPTQYINAVSERTVEAWNDLTTRMPHLKQDNLYLLHPTMANGLETPVARLMPEGITAAIKNIYPREIGSGIPQEKWVESEYVVNQQYMIDRVENAKSFTLTPNEALLFAVNGAIKADARMSENMSLNENPPKYFPQLDNSQLPDDYKCAVELNTKMFDFIERNNDYVNSLDTRRDVEGYNSNKVLADMLKHTDRNLMAKEMPLVKNEPNFRADYDMIEFFARDHLRHINSADALLNEQMKEPFVGVPMVLYKGNSFNANDLTHLRAIPSYVKIPESSNLKPFGNYAINSAHLMQTGEYHRNNFDAESHFANLDAANPRAVVDVRIKPTMSRLMSEGLDNPNHPSYDRFTIKPTLDEVAIHEDMSESMITDQVSLTTYYKETLNFQAEQLLQTIENIEKQPEHPQYKQVHEGDFNQANVYLVDYDPQKYPMLVVDHKLANRFSITSESMPIKLGQIDLNNKENLRLQVDNLARTTGFTNVLQSCSRPEKLIVEQTEFNLSPMRINDCDPNTKQITAARYAQELQSALAWKMGHLFSGSHKVNENYVLAMKPSTDTELAKFKILDATDPTAKASIDGGWKVITSHEVGLNLSQKYRDMQSTEFLTQALSPDDLLPKDLDATRKALIEAGATNEGSNTKQYLGDVGNKTGGAKKDRYGYHFSFEDISQMNMVDCNALITKSKIWKKPDFKQLAESTGDLKFAVLSQALYDLLPAKPKLLPKSEVNVMERVRSYAFYNDMVAGVRDATNESKNLQEFISRLDITSRQLNSNHARNTSANSLDSLYTTKKGWLGMSVSSLLLNAKANLEDAYCETRPQDTRFNHMHNLLEKAVRASTEKILGKNSDINYHIYSFENLDFSNNPETDKTINKELALYVNTGEVTHGMVEKLSESAKAKINTGEIVVRNYEDVLATRPAIELPNENPSTPTELTAEPNEQYGFKGLVNDIKSIAVVEPVEGREGIITQKINSSKWQMLNSNRIGSDYRQGKNIDAFGLRDTFGMNAVEFGSSTPLYVRQEVTNLAYDSLRDLANILKLNESKIALGTGLAFASRGAKGAKAHYEPDNNIINISGQNGSGSLAHEWFHSLDNYLAKVEKNYLLSQDTKLTANEVHGAHFLSSMVDNGYKPRTPMAQMMVEIVEAMKFKEQVAPQANSNGEENSLMEQLSIRKNTITQQWNEKAQTFSSTGPTFKVAGIEPSGDTLQTYLKWSLQKAESIADAYNGKIEKYFAKDAKHCKDDKDLSGFNYACDQYNTFIEKSSPQFGLTSITAFVKSEYPHYSEKQRKEVTEGLSKDIAQNSIPDVMGKLHQELNLAKATEFMRNNLAKYAPDQLKANDLIDSYVRNNAVAKKLDLPEPVVNTAKPEVATTSKPVTDFYAFAKERDQQANRSYWSSTHELFARTGEAYVVKKLKDEGFENTFLASGWSNEQYPYLPMGADLEAIEKKLDTLVEYVGEHILQSNKVQEANKDLDQTLSLESEKKQEKQNDQNLENERDGLVM